ncbi:MULTISPECIES: porin [Myroides]|uniref:porin n=1 Tax=Myroides TaxID=76831 RepID=UPI001303D0E8|nr:porin [Myroides phaeus]
MIKRKISLFLLLAMSTSLYSQTDSIKKTEPTALFTINGNKDVVNYFNLYLDSRYDFNTTFNGQQTDNSNFQVNQTRMYLTTKFLDKVEFSMRYSLLNNNDNPLEFAVLEYFANEKWSFAAGRLMTGWGSFEIDYNGGELYMYSNIYPDIEVYSNGASVSYHTPKSTYTLQFISPGDGFVAEKYKNKAFGYLGLWQGELFDGKLKTRYGYGLLQHDASRYYNWVTIGNRLDIDNLQIEADWMFGYRNLNYSSILDLENDLGNTYIKDNATTLSLKYKIDKVVPYVKGMYSKRNDLDNGNAYSVVGVQGAVEYYPFSEPLFKDIRLFASYNYQNTTFDKNLSNLSDSHQHQVICGVRWLVPLVKK